MFADAQKHVLASLSRTSYWFLIRRFPSNAKGGAGEPQNSPKIVSLSGNVPQGVVRFTPPEQSLCFLHDTDEQSKRRLLAFWHAGTLEDVSTKKVTQLVRRLFHATTGLLTDCELEPSLVSVESVDHSGTWRTDQSVQRDEKSARPEADQLALPRQTRELIQTFAPFAEGAILGTSQGSACTGV